MLLFFKILQYISFYKLNKVSKQYSLNERQLRTISQAECQSRIKTKTVLDNYRKLVCEMQKQIGFFRRTVNDINVSESDIKK